MVDGNGGSVNSPGGFTGGASIATRLTELLCSAEERASGSDLLLTRRMHKYEVNHDILVLVHGCAVLV
jgi:hypothetical protein